MSPTPVLAQLQEPYVASGFGESAFQDQTTLHPVGLAAVLLLGVATLVVKRRNALLPMLVLACFVSTAQRVVIATLDFNLVRVMVLFGFLRLMARGEYRSWRRTPVDSFVIAWAVVSLAAYSSLRGNIPALIYQLGVTFDVIGLYVLVRCWVQDWRDLDRITWAIAWLAIPSFVFFAIEHLTGRNFFAFLGGVSPVTMAREGRLRCQGPFLHPILAGCFWAVLLPLTACRWWRPGGGTLAVSSSLAIIGIVIFSASSTPLLVLGAVLLGGALFKLRTFTRVLRWSLLCALIMLHLVMEQPVWHLITRINVVGGSTGFHRFRLIDAAVNRFSEWALMGTHSTAHWGYFLFDVTNQYVKECVRAGFLGLVLFLCFIGLAFGRAGRLWRLARGQRFPTAMAWALGVSLFAHVCMFNAASISHSQQSLLVWFLVIGTLVSLSHPKTGVARLDHPQLKPVSTRPSGRVRHLRERTVRLTPA
jgi:hypothetical protein